MAHSFASWVCRSPHSACARAPEHRRAAPAAAHHCRKSSTGDADAARPCQPDGRAAAALRGRATGGVGSAFHRAGCAARTWKTRLVRRCCARLSQAVPSAIVSDARSSAALYAKLGFSAAKLRVVPNGVDAAAFRPDHDARERVRQAWDVTPDEMLLGCVARWDPLKDHENLLRALRQLADRGRRLRCALVGRGMEAHNRDLQRLIERCGVAQCLILAGASGEVPR